MSTSATSVTESPEKSRVKSPNSTLAFCEMHGNSYIRVHGIHLYPYGEIHNVQQLLPRKSLSCKLVGKRSGLSLEAFLKDHYLSGSPVVIRDSMDQWPAKNKWNGMNYLRKVAGFRTVPIEKGSLLHKHGTRAGCRESVLRCYRREVYSISMERELPVTLGSSLEFTDLRWSKMLQMRYSFSGIKRNRLVLFLIMIYWLWTLDSVSGTDGADANMLKSSS
ncbi:hypothetical protein FXO37_02938 [Capsicum annuum]|nr:hypothetical protein FXO37_02938 [Capsicum annuum]